VKALRLKKQGAAIDRRQGTGTDVLAALKEILPQPIVRQSSGAMVLCQIDDYQPTGFVLDYTLLTSQSDFTFRGDETYHVSGSVFLTGTTTIEGGTAVKSSVNQGDGITLGDWDGEVVWKTGPYRPA